MRILSLAAASALFASAAHAAKPTDGALGFQPAVTEIASDGHWFHNYILLPMCIIISVFILALLLWTCWKYSAKNNPVPSKTTHNATLEVVWTSVPVLILIGISVISFPYLFKIDKEPDLKAIAAGEITATVEEQAAAAEGWVHVKAIGQLWSWTYEYSDYTDQDGAFVNFPSNALHKGLSSDEQTGELNLSVDTPMVIPAGRYIRYYTGSDNVIHSWAVPAFGIKTDAIPGRLNEGWFKVDDKGTYYGQCSELCGKDHAYMPIEILVVDQPVFDEWMELMKVFDTEGATALARRSLETRVAQVGQALN